MRSGLALLLAGVAACADQRAAPRPGLQLGGDGGSTTDAPMVAPDVAGIPRLDPPDCGAALAPGSVRGTIEGIIRGVAIDDRGNLYGVRLLAEYAMLASYDPCLRPRWEAGIGGAAMGFSLAVMADRAGATWVTGAADPGVYRFSGDGTFAPFGFAIEDRLFTWIGVPDGAGPVFSTQREIEETYLHRVDAAGGLTSVRLPAPSSFVWRGECLVHGATMACFNIAYDLPSLALRWFRENAGLVDGTLRNVLPPACDGERLWTVRYGISTYDLVAVDLATGAERVAAPLARTSRGQSDLLIGPPVIAGNGLVVVYMSAHRSDGGADGRLEAFAADGTRRWSLDAPRTPRANGAIFSGEATHVAGRGGLIYLAVGESVYAVDETDGAIRWRLDGLGDLDEPGTNLSPNGELYVRTRDGTLIAIATESPGLADSPWPAPGGTHRLTNAR